MKRNTVISPPVKNIGRGVKMITITKNGLKKSTNLIPAFMIDLPLLLPAIATNNCKNHKGF
jgi:hypothetical protein